LPSSELEDCKEKIRKTLGKQLYSKRYKTNKITYAMVFLGMIAVAAVSVVLILKGSKVLREPAANPSESARPVPPENTKYSETGIILSIVVCVVCLILSLVASSYFFKRDGRRSKQRQQLLDQIETELNE